MRLVSEYIVKSAMACKKLNKDVCKTLLSSADTFLVDCDGVLWNGDSPIEKSADAVSFLTQQGKNVILLTNNSTKSRQKYVEKCQKIGFKDITSADKVITTSAIAADYLKNVVKLAGRVYMIGSTGVKDELDHLGIQNTGFGTDYFADYTDGEMLHDVQIFDDITAVLVGFDGHFSYPKLMKAATYLHNPDCLFVATNMDETMPSGNQHLVIPGTGSLVRTVCEAAGREPDAVAGKPSGILLDYIQRHFDIDIARTVMVGDRCKTDVKFGRDHGITTLFVQSGDQKIEDVMEFKRAGHSDLVPDFYVDRIGSLVELAS